MAGAGLAAPVTSAATPKEELRPLDASEHGLIVRLNQERQAAPGPEGKPLPPLSVSAALTQAASDYAEYLRATGQFAHQADGRAAVDRAREAGWDPPPGPGLSVAEALFEGASAEAAYSSWKMSPSHNAVMFHPDAHYVGLGRSADKWVLLVGGQCADPRCGGVGERGDPAADGVAAPRLRFHLRRADREVSVGVRVLRGDGRVLVRLRRADGRSARRLRVERRGNLWRYAFRLKGEGRWRATIRFRADGGWRSEVVRLRPFSLHD